MGITYPDKTYRYETYRFETYRYTKPIDLKGIGYKTYRNYKYRYIKNIAGLNISFTKPIGIKPIAILNISLIYSVGMALFWVRSGQKSRLCGACVALEEGGDCVRSIRLERGPFG